MPNNPPTSAPFKRRTGRAVLEPKTTLPLRITLTKLGQIDAAAWVRHKGNRNAWVREAIDAYLTREWEDKVI